MCQWTSSGRTVVLRYVNGWSRHSPESTSVAGSETSSERTRYGFELDNMLFKIRFRGVDRATVLEWIHAIEAISGTSGQNVMFEDLQVKLDVDDV